ncbi:hypothetical protein [Flavobacterium sp.]|uniref:hypothetical protein n=1 Tax=Flavobacterium sp. TaxID=239 RepID=UPI0025D76AEE|nr:hypothetical protein [Flavobacterium sp.]
MKEFKGSIKISTIFSDNPCPEPELFIEIGNITTVHSGGGGDWNPNNGDTPGGNSGGNSGGGGSNGNNPSTLASVADDDDNDETGEWDTTTDWHSKLSLIKVSPSDLVTPIDSSDPCPATTQIGILIPVDTCTKSFLYGLGSGGRDWLYAHNDDFNTLMDYISQSTNCEETSAYASEIMKQIDINPNVFKSIKPFFIEKIGFSLKNIFIIFVL